MKRFITYLYEYEGGHKSKGTGFCRVDVRGDQVKLDVHVQTLPHQSGTGKIYALIGEEGLEAIELGTVSMICGQGNTEVGFEANKLGKEIHSIEDLAGLGIHFTNNVYLASCWKDEVAEEIARGDFFVQKESRKSVLESVAQVEQEGFEEQSKVVEVETECKEVHIPHVQREPETIPEYMQSECKTTQESGENYFAYRKIDLNEIRNLPSPNWHYCNNSFLVHGFWNYGYLVLKTVVEENETKLYLGIPGIFEKPEMVMAVVFGFPEFEALPSQMVDVEMGVEQSFSNIEKNQEPKSGVFGCWFTSLHK